MENTENKIPADNPYTGELNPNYEELTGLKNPLSPNDDDDDDEYTNCFDTKKLIGKRFMYNGKYGISNWVDYVKNIEVIFHDNSNFVEEIKKPKKDRDFKFYGFSYKLIVRSTKNNVYEFDKCVFLEN